MKLSDIVIQEEAPEGDKPIELKELIKYFPNTYQKAVKTLAKSGRLTFNGQQVFTKSGDYGPAIEQAIAEAEAFLKDEDTTVDVTLELDGAVADIDDGGEFSADYPLDEFQEVYVGYTQRGDKLLIGFDVWLDEEIFNQDFDKEFEKTFGEDFDNDNPDHEKIFKKTWEEFKEISFMGVLVAVDENGSCDLELSNAGGFYGHGSSEKFGVRGIYNAGVFKGLKAIDFRLD